MKYFLKFLSLLIIVPTIYISFMIGGVCLMEGYNIFNPYIDTEFAPNYSPEKFEMIKVGMDSTEVKKIIGEPLFRSNGDYYYTQDGFLRKSSKKEFMINDFAWSVLTVGFDSKGKVVVKRKEWGYD